MGMVVNNYGVNIDFDVAVMLMDDEIREQLHYKLAPCSDQLFFDSYAKEHELKFNEVWELAKENPCY